MWKWIEDIALPYLTTLIQLGLIAPDEAEAFRARWEERRADPHAFFCSSPVLAVVGVKPIPRES